MKTIGIVREVDQLGRVVIPKETRTMFGIAIGDPLEIYVEGEHIIFRKYQSSCCFCDNASELIDHKGKKICKECLEGLKDI